MKTRIYPVLTGLFIIAIIYLSISTTTAHDLTPAAAGTSVVQTSTIPQPTTTQPSTATHTPTLSMSDAAAATATAGYEDMTLRVYVENNLRGEHLWYNALPVGLQAASRQDAELIITIEESNEEGSRSAQYYVCGIIHARVTIYTATISSPDNPRVIAHRFFRGPEGSLPFTIRGCSPPAGPPPGSEEFVQWLVPYTRTSALTPPPSVGTPQASLTEILSVLDRFILYYPAGWVTQINADDAGGGNLALANSESAFAVSLLGPNLESYLPGEVSIVVIYVSVSDLFDATMIRTLFLQGFVEDGPEVLITNNGSVNRYVERGRYDQAIFTIDIPDGQLLLRIATAPGELILWEPLALEILESITFP